MLVSHFYYYYFSHTLEAVFVLLCCPVTVSTSAMFLGVRDFFVELLKTQSGLLFLTAKAETVNGIIRTLTQSSVSFQILLVLQIYIC